MIFIPGNMPSLKNSKVKGIYHPKTVTKYLRSLNIQTYSSSKKTVKGYRDPNRPNLFIKYIGDYFKEIEYPVVIGTHFVRKSKHRFDIINAQQLIFDLLTAHNYIEDDNANCIIPVTFRINGKNFSTDKESPGTWLKIFRNEWDLYDVKMKTLQEHK
jgi:hypothetical protein